MSIIHSEFGTVKCKYDTALITDAQYLRTGFQTHMEITFMDIKKK